MKRISQRTMNNSKHLIYGLLFIFLLTFIFQNASAQMGLAIGAKGGVSLNTFRGTDLENIDNRTNWLGGLFVNVQLSPAVALQPELLFNQRGADYTSNNVRTRMVINYFEVPVLAKIRLPLGDVVFPHILLGPNFAFRTKLDYSSTDTQSGTVVTTSNDDIRKSDIGALLGAGVDIQTRSSGVFFTIDGRYGFGFNNLNRSDNSVEIRNAGWMFAVGIGFLFR